MARPLREISSTGIYHVMLRGINRQVIFEHPVDYRKFIDLLCLMVSPSDELGRSLPSLCRIYAYCLMPNHVHMIIQEKSENLSTVIHRIATAYALYYNMKYERCSSQWDRCMGKMPQSPVPPTISNLSFMVKSLSDIDDIV